MYLAELFRSFRPLHNPIGFGVADFLLLAVALLFTLLIMSRAVWAQYAAEIAERTAISMTLLAAVAIFLRLAMLRHCPVPVPSGADDFSYILSADTLRHLRLANAARPLHQFFEAVFVLQQPKYSSIYPLGQGITLALGRLFFGTFWAGVLLSMGAVPAFCYWMLRGWIAPRWALAGGLLAVIEFGPLNQWTNSYWGGALSACAGCLVFGALPRLSDEMENEGVGRRTRNAVLLGFGFALQLLTRPFECVLLAACVILYWLPVVRTRLAWTRMATIFIIVGLTVSPAAILTLLQNRAVTGSWTTLPYMLSRYQYGVPTTFTWQPIPVPHHVLTPEQDLDYRAQSAIHGLKSETAGSYLRRLLFRVRYLRFFLIAPLYFAVLAFLPNLGRWRWAYLFVAMAIFFAGINFYPYFFPHYIAASTGLFVLVAVKGLESLSRVEFQGRDAGKWAARFVFLACGVQFFFWYGLYLSGSASLLSATRYETWDFVNYGDPEGRLAVGDTLAHSPGKQLVFVQYGPQHRFHEWIGNRAVFDAERVVWALDLGVTEDEKLLKYYSDRKAWLLQPDAIPPKLSAYAKSSNPFLSVH